MTGKRVLLLTQWFDPEPTFKGLLFARELVRRGLEVEVVTGFPNYPGGKLYPGYSVKWMQREMIDGVRVTRVPLYPSHDQSAIRRVLNYLTFAASSLIYGLFVARRSDVIYAYHPPLTVGISAGLISLLRRIPLVYDIQDMWPDTLRATGMLENRRALRLVAAVCLWVYRRATRIVVLSPGFKRLLIERGVPAEKVDVIYNWADEGSTALQASRLHPSFPSSDRFRILFAGNMGKAQALGGVLDAADLLKAKGSKVSFVMMGGGVEVARLRQEVATRGLENVVFLPAVPMADVGAYLHEADVLLVHLRKDPLFEITIPSKTQAYMAAGKPLLMAVGGDAAELVRQSGGGLVTESGNASALAHAAETLSLQSPEELAAMGRQAQDFYRENLSVSVGTAKFVSLFNRLATCA